jgi:hypothetical protein
MYFTFLAVLLRVDFARGKRHSEPWVGCQLYSLSSLSLVASFPIGSIAVIFWQ